MRRLKLIFILSVLACAVAGGVSATEFERSCSLTGSSPQRLSVVLTACGYTGSFALKELTVANPDTNANDICLGQSDVDCTNGKVLHPGDSTTRRSSGGFDIISATDKYLYTSGTENVTLSVRSN